MIRLRITADPAPAATALYLPDDHMLVAGPDGRAPAGAARASLDTLTLLFAQTDHRFLGLDAYTNAERWERRDLRLPKIDEEAAVICVEPFDAHGVARVAGRPVHCTYSPVQTLLHVQVDDGEVAAVIRCLSCVVCGLGVGGELIELWVEDVAGVLS